MGRPIKDISIKSLAEEAGVSHMTISRVLNNRAGVSEAVRLRVKALQEKYKFKTNYQSETRVKIAVVLVSDGLTDYYSQLLNGVLSYSKEHDIETAMVIGSQDSTRLLKQIRDMQCSAVIFPQGKNYEKLCGFLANSQMPAILLDIKPAIPQVGYIDNDSYSGSCDATQYLLDLGHRNIGYIIHGEDSSNSNHNQRIQGYRDTLNAAGIKIEPFWVQCVNELENELKIPYWDSVPFAVERLLARAPELTAIMTVDDSLALRVMGTLQRLGRRIPEEISVVGFDDHQDSSHWYPSLTTVRHQLSKAGYMAAEALEYAIKHPGDWNLPRTVLPTSLIIRESAAACRDNGMNHKPNTKI